MPEHLQAIPVGILITGMRAGEFFALHDTDLRPLTRSVRVPGTKTDASEDVVPVAPELWQWIERAVPCPVALDYFRRQWRRARAGIADQVTIHDLRHCHGQWIVAAGGAFTGVQSTLRHTSAEMSFRYARMNDAKANAQRMVDVLRDPRLDPRSTTGGAASA